MQLLGKGNERECFVLDGDETKVIKIAYRLNKRDQNRLEYLYYQHLDSRGVDYTHISKCFGYKSVEGKEGLVFERVSNEDGSIADSLASELKNGTINGQEAIDLLQDLYEYLQDNRILFVDVGLDNILCKRFNNGEVRLVIIDGLGARRPGLKLWLYMHLPFYAKYKIYKQYDKIINNFRSLCKDFDIDQPSVVEKNTAHLSGHLK